MAYTFKKNEINSLALIQSEHWYDRTGKRYNIEDMSSWHARGALNKLWQAFGEKALHTPLYRALERQMRKSF